MAINSNDDYLLVKKSLEGDKASLEGLIDSIQSLVYNLSLRFLWLKEDAEDATQEILIKVITNLSKFEGKSNFKTWVYRVSVNYLLNLKQTKLEKTNISFDAFAQDLNTITESADYNLPDRDLLEKEMKTGCTLAMLQCLDRKHRIAFILGSSLKLDSNLAAQVTETTPDNFRKRLQKSRAAIKEFLNGNCGIYNPENNCRCNKRINSALACGRINKTNLSFGGEVYKLNEEMEELNSLSGIYNNHGMFLIKEDLIVEIKNIINSKKIIVHGEN